MGLWNKIRVRLPGGTRFRSIQDAWRMYRKNRSVPFYQYQLVLNIKSFFCLAHYVPLRCCAVEHRPSALYHVTAREHCQKILREGLHHKKYNIVFLTDTYKFVTAFQKLRCEPVVLRIDAGRMYDDGYDFFNETHNRDIYLTYFVPAEYVSLDHSA